MPPNPDWNAYTSRLFVHESLGLYLDDSRMQLSAEALGALEAPMQRAFEAMAALESGAIANPDENRMVGHYWLRHPALAPSEELTRSIEQTAGEVRAFGEAVLGGALTAPGGARFTDAVCVGIGGSALGPQLLVDALAPVDRGLQLHFLDNTDPSGIARVLKALASRLPTTLVVVTSKSGSTPETRNGMLEVAAAMEAAGLTFAEHAVAITGDGSQLDKVALRDGWRARFPMHDWVGGRTSVLSAVGLVPAALAGLHIDALLAGAREMDEATRAPDMMRNPAARLAAAWHVVGRGRGARDMVVLPYSDALLLFSRYLQQLIMESLGKGLDLDGEPALQGIAVYGNKGSTDQHAYVQQLREGLHNFFVTFIEVLAHDGPQIEVAPDVTSADYLTGFLHGTREALFDNDRESITITVERLDERRLAALIALYERAVGLYAILVNINAYHQPGVEAGKKAASARLEVQARVLTVLRDAGGEPLDIAAVAGRAGADAESVYQICRHLAANRADVQMLGSPAAPASLQVRIGPAA